MDEYSTIIKPITTEKSSIAQSKGQYTFLVKKDATKIDIKKAIKAIYGVDVNKVTVSLIPKKIRVVGRGRIYTKRPVLKKATVSLKNSKTIDPNKIKKSKKK